MFVVEFWDSAVVFGVEFWGPTVVFGVEFWSSVVVFVVEFWGSTVVFVVEFWGPAVELLGNDVVFADEMVVLACVAVRFWLGVVNDGTV